MELNNYKIFLEELEIVGLVNETYIYYSPDLERVLLRLDSPIAKDLIGIHKNDIDADITFVGIEDGGDQLSFTTKKNSVSNLNKVYGHGDEGVWFSRSLSDTDLTNIWNNRDEGTPWNKSRSKIRIGRFINRVFPGKYTNKEIEDFINKLKSKINQKPEFRVVEGSEIAHWYKSENYSEIKGTLGNSCMRSKDGSIFEIYVQNPEVCRMVILLEDDKLVGRALLWKLNSCKGSDNKEVGLEYFMDRQYTIGDHLVESFREYAREMGWGWKTKNNHHSFDGVSTKEGDFYYTMTVKLNKRRYINFPYMDTFRRYSPDSSTLYNDNDNDSSNSGQYILEDTDGGFLEIGEEKIWSEWHDRELDPEDAVWSDWADSYLDRDRAIYLESGRRSGWYPEDCDDIVWDGWRDEHIHVDDSVWSDWYDHSIRRSSATDAIIDIDFDGEPRTDTLHEDDNTLIGRSKYKDTVWYGVMSKAWSGWTVADYCHENVIMEKGGKYLLSGFTIEVRAVSDVYGDIVEGSDVEGLYLSKSDAKLLGVGVSGNIVVMDIFEYYQSMSKSLYGTLVGEIGNEIKRIEIEISGGGQMKIPFGEDSDVNQSDNLRFRLNYWKDRLKKIRIIEGLEN